MIVPSASANGQNSAYRHHIMKGAPETERLSLVRHMGVWPVPSVLRRFLYLIDAFFNLLNGRMQFLKNLVFFPGKVFDTPSLLM